MSCHIVKITYVLLCKYYATQHILNIGHKYGTIEGTMKILHRNKKGRLLNTVEQFYIYIDTKQNSHLNDLYSDSFNPIYDTLFSYTSQQYTT
jgi:hypothetical protein